MGRYIIILRSARDRMRAKQVVDESDIETWVEFRQERRTHSQNDLMWAMLSDIAEQATLHDRKWSTDEWKAIFMQACGYEIRILPSLDSDGFFPYGHRSSKLTKEEMSNLIDFMSAWGAENGIQFRGRATAA